MKKTTDGHQEAAAVRSIPGSGAASHEMQAETKRGVAEDEDADVKHSDCCSDTPAQPGILTRLARSVCVRSVSDIEDRWSSPTHIRLAVDCDEELRFKALIDWGRQC